MEESVFRPHAEVTDRQETHLFQNEFPGQLELDGRVAEEVLEGQRWYLHDVADV